MKNFTWLKTITLLYIATFSFTAFAQTRPNTFIINPDLLVQNKFKINAGNEQCLSSLKNLLLNADAVMHNKPYSIINKPIAPPSGSKNDYLSLATYWWPNPTTKTGLPYIKKDGLMNPEVRNIKDGMFINQISNEVQLLGLAYYFTDDEKYAKKATELLKVFFLDKSTKMNPNLNYAQIVRGVDNENGVGTIDTEDFVDLIDGVQLLVGSASWTTQRHVALKNWFKDYLNWMLTSPVGKEGAEQPNNIGTFYDLQVVTYSLFIGNSSLAQSILKNQTFKRIDKQITPEGIQRYEVKRTKSWTYSTKNLEAWFKLANCAESAGVNLWNYTTSSGSSLKKAFEFMLPYAVGTKPWPYPQISKLHLDHFIPLGRTGSVVYKDLNLNPLLTASHARFVSGNMMDLLYLRYNY